MYYIKDITNTFKILIDTGAGLSIFKPKTVEKYSQRCPENLIIQGITDQSISINQSTYIPFNTGDPHKVYIYNLDIEFDGLLGSDFLEHYDGVVDIKNRKLITNFKTVPLYKAGDEENQIQMQENQIINQNQNQNKTVQNQDNFTNKIVIEPRTEKVVKL